MSTPTVYCDWCGEEITEAAEGNYEWPLWTDEVEEIYYTHKRCCWAFEQATPHVLWGAIGLECLPVYLGNGLNVNWKAAKQTAQLMGTIG